MATARPSFHPFAESFPLLEGAEFDRLVASIKDKGLKTPIIRRKSDGVFVDGRNRWRACELAGVKVQIEDRELTEEETIDLIAILNIERRHLKENQRAALAEEYVEAIIECRRGIICQLAINSDEAENGRGRPDDGVMAATKDAAQKFNVSERSIGRARAVKKADPELAEKAKKGEISLHAAEKVIKEKKNPKPAEEVPAVKDVLDKEGGKIPNHLKPIFEDLSEYDEIKRLFAELSRKITALSEKPSGVFIHAQSVKSDLSNAKRGVTHSAPHAVCPWCKGKCCDVCRQSGFVNEQLFEKRPK